MVGRTKAYSILVRFYTKYCIQPGSSQYQTDCTRGGPQKCSEGWSISPTKLGWKSWVCLDWRRLWILSKYKEGLERQRRWSNTKRGIVLNWKRVGIDQTQERFFFFFNDEDGETWEQVAWRSYGYPISGSIQAHAGWSSEQVCLVKAIPAHITSIGTRWSDLWMSLPT